jgi:hypothetical protein
MINEREDLKYKSFYFWLILGLKIKFLCFLSLVLNTEKHLQFILGLLFLENTTRNVHV